MESALCLFPGQNLKAAVFAVHAAWMAYDCVPTHTNPALHNALQRLENAFLMCKEQVEKKWQEVLMESRGEGQKKEWIGFSHISPGKNHSGPFFSQLWRFHRHGGEWIGFALAKNYLFVKVCGSILIRLPIKRVNGSNVCICTIPSVIPAVSVHTIGTPSAPFLWKIILTPWSI